MADPDFRSAIEVVNKGDFDEIKASLEALGFKFVEGENPDHWTYYHPGLREDPNYRYPGKLYRPHGSRRDTKRVARCDQAAARRMIRALKVILASEKEEVDDV